VIVDPIVSIVLSVWLFGERFTSGAAVLALAAAGFAVMCAGVVALTQTTPATMEADMPSDKQDGERHDAAGSGREHSTKDNPPS
jgi:hypothetical protein